MTRAFVAIALPQDTADAAEDVAVSLPVPRTVQAENMHLTLQFLGDLTTPQLDDIHSALSAIRAPGFMLQLAGLDTFGGARPRSVHLRCRPEPALDHLQCKVVTATRQAGLQPERRRFTPHVTLARFSASSVDRARLGAALLDEAGVRIDPFPVTEFHLIESQLGRSGSTYHMLARYPLEPAP